MRKRLFLSIFSILLACISPALAGSEFMLAPPTYSSAPELQTTSSIASDGRGYFAAWTDHRAPDDVQRIYGARLSLDGQPLEPAGIILSDEFTGEARVVFAGGNYFVLWQTGSGAAAKRVSPDGEVLDSVAMHPFPEPCYFTGAIATNGSEIAVIWQTAKFEPHVSILDSSGAMKSDVAIDIVNSAAQVAWNGTSFVISAIFYPQNCYPCPSTSARFYFVRVDGMISGPISTPAVVEHGSYVMSALGNRILLVGTTRTTGYSMWLFDDEGSLVREVLGFDSSIGANRDLALTNDGTDFLLTWIEARTPRRLLAATVTREGVMPPEPEVITTATWLDTPSIAVADGGHKVVSWTAYGEGAQSDVFARPLATRLQPSGEAVRVTNGTPAQDRPAVGSTASMWLTAWIEHRGSEVEQVVVTRRARDGSAIDSEPLVAASLSATPSTATRHVAAASNGEDFLVAWLDEPRLFARRLSAAGAWLDPQPLLISEQAGDLTPHAIAWNGASYFLVWSRYTATSTRGPLGVSGVPVSSDGTVGPLVQIAPELMVTTDAMVARVGDNWLVVWTYHPPFSCQITCPAGDSDILAARLAFTGTLLDTAPIQISPKHDPNGQWEDYAVNPTVASSGDVALVTWRAGLEVRGARLAGNGEVLDSPEGNGTALLTGVRGDWRAEAGWNGTEFLLLSSRKRESQNTVVLYRIADSPLRASGTGYELSRGPWAIYNSGSPSAAIDARSDGSVFVAYPRATFDSPYNGVSRIFGRTFEVSRRTRAIGR